jgi:hypothetical protein
LSLIAFCAFELRSQTVDFAFRSGKSTECGQGW